MTSALDAGRAHDGMSGRRAGPPAHNAWVDERERSVAHEPGDRDHVPRGRHRLCDVPTGQVRRGRRRCGRCSRCAPGMKMSTMVPPTPGLAKRVERALVAPRRRRLSALELRRVGDRTGNPRDAVVAAVPTATGQWRCAVADATAPRTTESEGTATAGVEAGPAQSAQARVGGGADSRRGRPRKSRKRHVRLARDLPLVFAAAGAHDHESDVAWDVEPCLYVVLSVAAHLCRPTCGVLDRPGRGAGGPGAQVGMVSMVRAWSRKQPNESPEVPLDRHRRPESRAPRRRPSSSGR